MAESRLSLSKSSDTENAESELTCSTKCTSSNESSSFTPANVYNMCQYDVRPDLLHKSLNKSLKFLSPAASSGPFCRICHEGDNCEDLVSLCKCTGSVGLVHLSCMERWLSTRRDMHDKCEICNFKFETIRSPKSIVEWYQSSQGEAANRHGILGDVACFSLITPLATVSAFLCYEGAKRQVKWKNSLEAGCLMALATFLITIYIVWNILTLRYHLKSFLRWRSVNQNVRLVRVRRKATTASDLGYQQNTNGAQDDENAVSRPVCSNPQSSPFQQVRLPSNSE